MLASICLLVLLAVYWPATCQARNQRDDELLSFHYPGKFSIAVDSVQVLTPLLPLLFKQRGGYSKGREDEALLTNHGNFTIIVVV